MKIDPDFYIDPIAADASRDVLNHVNITTWNGEPVAIVADGFCMAMVPIEMDDGDVPGLVHVSVFAHARALGRQQWEPMYIGLGAEHITFEDGWTAPREIHTGGKKYPDVNQIIPRHTTTQAPVNFGIQPKLLAKLAEACGRIVVAVHHTSNDHQIVVAPMVQGDELKPPFGVMMLAHMNNVSTSPPSERELANVERVLIG